MDRRVIDVARFEFFRHLDMKGEALTLGILLVIALVRFGGEALMALMAPHAARIAIEAAAGPLPPRPADGRFEFVSTRPQERDATLTRVTSGQIAGLLVADGPSHYQLYVAKRVSWQSVLVPELQAVHQGQLAAHAGIPLNMLNDLAKPPGLTTTILQSDTPQNSLPAEAVAISLMILTLLGTLSTQQLIVQGICNEKSGHITAMVLSAIPVPLWLDGKLAAAWLHGLKTVVSYGLYSIAAGVLLGLLPMTNLLALAVAWPQWVTVVLLCGSGLAFWSAIFLWAAALLPSATSPIRNVLMFIPMTCLALCLSGLHTPDNLLVVALSYLPPTAGFAMPLRIVAETANAADVLAAILVSAYGTLLVRRRAIVAFQRATGAFT